MNAYINSDQLVLDKRVIEGRPGNDVEDTLTTTCSSDQSPKNITARNVQERFAPPNINTLHHTR